MPTPTPGTWLSLLFELSARRRADAAPWRTSLNLSTTTPQTTPPTENFQTEIATVVAVAGQRFTLSSGGGTTLQISRSTDPAVTAPSLVQRLEYGNVPASASAAAAVWVSQAVASFGSLVAVALSPDDYTGTATRAASGGKGIVRFYRANANGSLTLLQDVSVGYLPDSIAFNSTGSQLVIANEGEPTRDYQINGVDVDRPGSIGIIDIKNASGTPSFSYAELGFAGLSLPAGIRISGKAGLSTQATDIEPEYVSINGNFADVTLQENNGVAKVNLRTKTIESVFDLGSVDFATQLVDISDRDGAGSSTLIKPVYGNNVRGLRMADGIAAFTLTSPGRFARGNDYFITANEGDGREYGTFLDESRRNTGLSSRLKTLSDDSTVPYTAFGSRSASLFDANTGALLWDSGTMLKDVADGDQLQISSLITNGEVTNGLTAGSSVFAPVGIFDGLGAYDNNDGTYSLLVNHELANTNGYQYQLQVKAGNGSATTQTVTGARISRLVVAKDIDNNAANGVQSRVLAGGVAYDQVISPDASFSLGSGLNRFCSANLISAGQFSGRGFADTLYLAGEESGNGRIFVLDLSAAFAADGLLADGANTSLKVIVDADRLTGLQRQSGIRNPDGLAWSANGSLYVQEDRSLPNGSANGAFGSEEASIWKVDAITGASARWAQIDRSAVPTTYGQSDAAPADIGNWESAAPWAAIRTSAVPSAMASAWACRFRSAPWASSMPMRMVSWRRMPSACSTPAARLCWPAQACLPAVAPGCRAASAGSTSH